MIKVYNRTPQFINVIYDCRLRGSFELFPPMFFNVLIVKKAQKE